MSLDRVGAEALGWVYASEQDGAWRAEKYVGNGLVNQAGATEFQLLAAVESWEARTPHLAPGVEVQEVSDLAGVAAPGFEDAGFGDAAAGDDEPVNA